MFDPSKMDPKVLMEMSQLLRDLPHDKLMKMQSLMHNMMAGLDVRKEMEEFERGLPPGFREKLLGLMMKSGASPADFGGGPGANFGSNFGAVSGEAAAPLSVASAPVDLPGNIREARLTILRAVAEGNMTPEEAEAVLFTAG